MSLPNGVEAFNYVEVRFKNGRKHFFKNTENLSLSIGDVVATEASPGHDVGVVALTGELVRVQMKKKKVRQDSAEILKIYRKASQRDIDIWQEAREKEERMKIRAREIAIRLRLSMKISDIEFQGDGSKATFYYTAEERVDFRQLIKEFAREFNTRIEMRQIGFRQEASRLGGIGSCGRELCCSTWLTDFRSVNTSAARYQQLSLNPQKLAGQCGKLKCCLNYELDTIWLSASVLNFPLAKVLITPESVKYYEKIGGTYFDGDFSLLSRLLGTPLDFQKVQNLLIGQTIYDLRTGGYKLTESARGYQLEPSAEDFIQKMFLLDTKNFRTVAQQLSQVGKARSVTVTYPEYQEAGGRVFPKQIKIIANHDRSNTQVDMEFRSLEFDVPVRFPFDIPSGYDEIILE